MTLRELQQSIWDLQDAVEALTDAVEALASEAGGPSDAVDGRLAAARRSTGRVG